MAQAYTFSGREITEFSKLLQMWALIARKMRMTNFVN